MKLRLHVFTIANKKLGDQNPHTVTIQGLNRPKYTMTKNNKIMG